MITIRPVEEKDVEILSMIQIEAFLPLWERYHDLDNPYLRGSEDISSRLYSPFFHFFCILDNEEIVGGLLYSCHGRTPFQSSGEYYLQRIFIRPERQNHNIARNAILLCEKEFNDATLFTVDFPEDLEKNRRCYIGAGFKDTGGKMKTESGIILVRYEKRIG